MSKYGDFLKFYLVDVKNIESDVTRSTFDEQKLEELADLILMTGCLLRPLILKQTKAMVYQVIERHFEYHAAVRANEKDTKRSLGGMVSAFVVVKQEIEATAVKQANALNETVATPSAKNKLSSKSYNTIDRCINNLETRLDNGLQEVKISQRQNTQRLEEQIKQLQLQIPKQLEPLEALNTLDVNKLKIGMEAVRMTAKKVQETAKKIEKERKKSAFTDLQDVVKRTGITPNAMVKIVDTWSKPGFFF